MDIRHYLKLVEAAPAGHNGGPLPITLVADGQSMGEKLYKIMQGGTKVGTAFAKYSKAKPGSAGGTRFSATIKGQEFSGSRARLLAWVEKLLDT